MSIIFGVFAIVCLGYYIFAASYAGIHSSFLSFWLMAAIGFLILMIFWYFAKKYSLFVYIPKLIKILVPVLLIIGVVLFLFVEGLIISKMNAKPSESVDYIIVLGAQVRGERVTKSLAKRLDAAIAYVNDNPETIILVSGGQGTGEDITEAEAMKRYLLDKNIKETLIIKEENSTSTKENLIFSKQLIQEDSASIAIVTNNFHVYRAVALAKQLGIDNVQGLAAPADNRLLLNYMMREFFAVVKEKSLGNI